MNLGDPELEVIDPTPNVHSLFLHFDKIFFSTKLASRAVVRWSKRMYSCAGVCSYEGRGGLCDIALSEPLLKLRSRKNLVETLIHEMIHAYLFVTGNDRDRDGHGPNFQSHMHRINKAAGLNITIYHDFHDEVRLYQTHWWRCNGPCQHRKPFFGTVRRSANRAPGPNDFWWEDHQSKCGGTFIKIKEPEKKGKKGSSKELPKPVGDITRFINNDNKQTGKGIAKSNSGATLVITKPGVVFNPKSVEKTIPTDSKGYILSDKVKASDDNVAETVRNIWIKREAVKDLSVNTITDITEKVRQVWANKVLESNPGLKGKKPVKRANIATETPPTKIKKIDSYFKKATDLIKDVYGSNYTIYQKDERSKLIAINDPEAPIANLDLPDVENVECPICSLKVESTQINHHIDECLNKQEIERICKEQPSCSKIIPSRVIKAELNDIEIRKVNEVKIGDLVENIDSKSLKPETNNNNTNHLFFINREEPNTSQVMIKKDIQKQNCPCCDKVTDKPMDEHLDECLAFFDNNLTEPQEGNSFSDIPTIVIDDEEDDIMDESQTMNATGTKSPCPVCLVMVETGEMNEHLDLCLE